MLKANEGDIISWEWDRSIYVAEVSLVDEIEHQYCVYVVYDDIGFTQDRISYEDVLEVWKKC